MYKVYREKYVHNADGLTMCYQQADELVFDTKEDAQKYVRKDRYKTKHFESVTYKYHIFKFTN